MSCGLQGFFSINLVAITPLLQMGKPRPGKKPPAQHYTICNLNRDSNQGDLTPGTEFLTPMWCWFPLQGVKRPEYGSSKGVSSELCPEVLTQSGALTRWCVCNAGGACWQWTHPLGFASPRSQAACTHPGALPPRAAWIGPIFIFDFNRTQWCNAQRAEKRPRQCHDGGHALEVL